ncbi:MAG: DNA repair protein RecO [Phycisphaerales bacterium]|nr:DNA repair protein RecO [Phycisphaerales bacterium]
MPTVVDHALVLRTWDFSETSQTVALFSRGHGLIRGLAKGSRREKSNFSGGFEVGTLGEFIAIVRPTQELANITGWDLQRVFWPVRRDLDAHRVALYAVDILRHAITDQDPHPRLFESALGLLGSLGAAAERGGVLLRFQWDLLVETGVQPRLDGEGLEERGRAFGFRPDGSGLEPDPGPEGPGGVWRVRADTIGLLRRLAAGDAVPMGPEASGSVDRANRLLAAYLRQVLGQDLPTREVLFGPERALGGRPGVDGGGAGAGRRS